MAQRTSKQRPDRGAELSAGAPFHPRLGDLALDLAQGGRIGVCVALPSDSSASYQLRPPAGGEDWRARADGSTLRPVPVPITHVTPMQRDVIFDQRARQAAIPVTAHYEDGGVCETVFVLTPAQIELYFAQFGWLQETRRTAPGSRARRQR
jgi:hypothetical protein